MENSTLMKKSYSGYALACFAFLAATTAVQLFNAFVLAKVLPESFTQSSAFLFLNIIIPEYIIGLPLLLLLSFKMDKKAPEKNKFGFGRFIVCFLLLAGSTGVLNIVGLLVHVGVLNIFGRSLMDNMGIGGIMMNSNPFWRILTVGILAPIVEEFIFRKFLIDRTYKYGEWVAIITSALMFGLFHGNFSQFFFATVMGGIMAYVYIRTGKVWITIIYHMIINLSTSVIYMGLYSRIDMEKLSVMTDLANQVRASGGQDAALVQSYTDAVVAVLPSLLPFALFVGFEFLLVMAGLVMWIIVLARKKVKVVKTEDTVEKGMKFAWGNVGMIIFVIGCLGLFVYNYIII